ncbi:MAG: hypothetical protein ABII18_02445 [bacterium]|nr:hypothetical protein [bacterium]
MATPAETMEYIWENIPKRKDGETISYSLADLHYLYFEGFVNTRRFAIETWLKSFDPFKKKNEYVLNKKQFISIRKFRYNGPCHEMFDVQKIRDGAWSDEELQLLYNRSIRQACELTEKLFWDCVDGCKQENKTNEKGELVIDADVKKGLGYIIARFPSPRTRLEYKVKAMRTQGAQATEASEAEKGKSKFAAGSTAVQTTMASLQKLQGSEKTKKEDVKPVKQAEEEIDIKKLRKPKGKVFG